MQFSDQQISEIEWRLESRRNLREGDGCLSAVVVFVMIVGAFWLFIKHEHEQDLTLRQIGTATGVYIDSGWIASPVKED